MNPQTEWTPAPVDKGHLKRNVFVGMSTLSAVVLALSYHTSLDAQAAGANASTSVVTAGSANAGTSNAGTSSVSGAGTSNSGTSNSGTSNSGTSAGTGSTASGSTSSGSGSSSSLKDGTYTGTAASTRWGDVQVQITVSGGKITASEAVEYPTANGKDQQINSRAVPTYNSEAVSAQSSQIDSISGATVTWQGYTTSLQSAIDQALA